MEREAVEVEAVEREAVEVEAVEREEEAERVVEGLTSLSHAPCFLRQCLRTWSAFE